MNHEEAQAKLEAYFQGSLDRETVRAFHAHLKGCEACRSSIRIRGAGARARRAGGFDGTLPAETRRQMAQNRAMLFRILLLMLLAALIYRVAGR